MDRFKRIAHRGWLRRFLSVATFGYFPAQDEIIHADWCITAATVVSDWTTTGTVPTDWMTTGVTVSDWTATGATATDWALTGATVTNWTLTAEVICCGC